MNLRKPVSLSKIDAVQPIALNGAGKSANLNKVAFIAMTMVAASFVDVSFAADLKDIGNQLNSGAEWVQTFLSRKVVLPLSMAILVSGGWMLRNGFSLEKVAATGGSIAVLNAASKLFGPEG